MTVTFSAYSEKPVDTEVRLDVWMSADNGAGQVDETYVIENLNEYSISMSSHWFGQERNNIYEVHVSVGTTFHQFYFDEEMGEIRPISGIEAEVMHEASFADDGCLLFDNVHYERFNRRINARD